MLKKNSHKILPVILLPFFILLAGCATAPRPPSDEALYLKELAGRSRVQWQLDTVTQVITLRRGSVTARALVGSDIVIIQGERIQLSSPIERDRDGIVVPPDFRTRVLARLVKTAVVLPEKKYRIILDAGHGGKDPGAVGRSGVREKDVVWDITKRLKRALENRGMSVSLTRKGDNFISLEERTEIAARQQVDLFVSIHANACKSRSVDGVEVYTLRPLSWKEKKEEQKRKNYLTHFNQLSMRKDNKILKKIVAEMMARKKKAESYIFAAAVAGKICRAVKADNRGVKEAGFFVLRNTLSPAVLIEVGFLSNSREERLLNDGGYRQKLAQAISDSIMRHLAN